VLNCMSFSHLSLELFWRKMKENFFFHSWKFQ